MISEKNIKNWIIIIPIIGVILSSIILTELFIYEIEKLYDFEKKERIIEEKNNIKKLVKSRVQNVINLLEKNYTQKIKSQKNEIKNTVDIAHNIIETIYKNYKHLGNQEVIKRINDKLRSLSFYENSSGYYFIFTLDGKSVLAPHAPQFEGIDFLKLDNRPYAKEFATSFLNLLSQKDEGFQEWKWYKPNETIAKEKIGYIKAFRPLNIFVGSGMYYEDMDLYIKNKIQELLNIITFEDKGYIFAYDKKGNTIAHFEESLIGSNRWDFLIDGRNTVQEIINKASNSNGKYINYTATLNPNMRMDESRNKISYVKEFKKTNWIIGTGMYTNTILKDIEKKQKKLKDKLDETVNIVIILSILITTTLIIIMVFLSNKVGQIFTNYRDHLKSINESLEIKVKDRTKQLEESRDKLKKLALLDPLTSLYNRRYFESVIDKLLLISKRKNEPLCLIIIDIDNFKSVNDNYGHDIGDEVIKSLANILLTQLRKSDVSTRIGGEEFSIVFPNTSLEDSYKISDKIRKSIEETVVNINEKDSIQFTVSIGLTIYNTDIDKKVNTILKRADQALYFAKNQGKNCVIIHNEGMK